MREITSLTTEIVGIARTREEMRELIDILTVVEDAFFSVKVNPLEVLKKHLPYKGFKQIEAIAQKYDIALDNAKELQTLFEKMKSSLQALPIVTLEVPFRPTEEILTNISQWFLINLNTPVILSILLNPEHIAGMIISYKGKYANFTLRKTFEDAITKTVNSL